MKKATVSYEGFRLSKLNDPRFSHLKLLLSWPPFLAMFFLTGRIYPLEECAVMYMPLDDLIPFCEWFVIPYVAWYLQIAFTLYYFLRHDVESFKRIQTFILLCQITSTVIFLVLPSCHQLRPAAFPRDNLLTDCVKLLYAADTPANACPSLHVTYAIGIAMAWCRCKVAHWGWKVGMVILSILICLATVFIKQHSAVDFFGALPLVLIAWVAVHLIYRKKGGEAAR